MSGEPEDFEAFEAARQAAERMSGWNGSRELWQAPTHQADPCPQTIRDRLAAAREAAAAHHRQQKARGLCL